MNLTPRQLAFLEHEMENIKDDPSRANEERSHASTLLGKVEGEIEFEKDQHRNEVPDEIPT